MIVEEFLEHYGVKGMRWGVRGRSKNPTKGFSKDAKRATTIRKKAKASPVKVKSLSNEEINTFLNRVSLESRFRQATPGRGTRALNLVKTILGTGKTVNEAVKFSDSPSGKALQTGMTKKGRAQMREKRKNSES